MLLEISSAQWWMKDKDNAPYISVCQTNGKSNLAIVFVRDCCLLSSLKGWLQFIWRQLLSVAQRIDLFTPGHARSSVWLCLFWTIYSFCKLTKGKLHHFIIIVQLCRGKNWYQIGKQRYFQEEIRIFILSIEFPPLPGNLPAAYFCSSCISAIPTKGNGAHRLKICI